MDLYDWLADNNLNLDNYTHWVDEENSCVTFPVYTIDCRFVGYQTISPFLDKKRRYFTWTSDTGLWGLDTIPVNYTGEVFVTESIWRTIYLHSVGVPSVSLMGSTISKRFMRLMNDHLRYKFIWVGDPDKAGRKLIHQFKHGGLTSPEYIDNMSQEELVSFGNYLKENYVSLHHE